MDIERRDPGTPVAQLDSMAPATEPMADMAAQPQRPLAEQGLGAFRSMAGRAAAVTALAACMVFGGEHAAAAAPTETVVAQATSAESGIDWSADLPLVLSILTTAGVIRNQTKEKREDRFNAALQGIKGESTGEERGARLRALDLYAKQRKFAPEVFRTAVEYLRGRRGGLEILRDKHGNDQEAFERAVRERRNADRSAFGLLLGTLPAARHRARRQQIVGHIKSIFRKDRLQALDVLTGTPPNREILRVHARAINLDYIRDVKDCDMSRMDLTGAGLQGNQITRIIFAESRLCEAQFEGTTVSRSDLRGTDLRAAYFHGAVFDTCIINTDTLFGNLPDGHPDARFGSLEPNRRDDYRGDPTVILKNLISDTLSPEQIIRQVHAWQRSGLKLLEGSNPEYILPSDAAPVP
jgi:pentapeptide repeat protein